MLQRVSIVGWLLILAGLPSLAAEAPARPGTRTITGRVVSATTSEPVTRAVVSVSATLDQTTTDERGSYSLAVGSGPVTLEVQALGYRRSSTVLGATDARRDISIEPAWTADQIRGFALQQDDPDYHPRVERPAYPKGRGPRVLIDEGHHNAHTATGRYRAFAAALEGDGYQVEASGSAFTPALLARAGILVVATPIDGLDDGTVTTRSPFKPAEVRAVRQWVEGGGALLVIADHLPVAAALAPLLEAFGVEGDNGYVFAFADGRVLARSMIFRRPDSSLRGHPITTGRTAAERIDSVATFTGFGFRAKQPFEPILVLRADAYSIQTSSWLAPALDSPKISVGGWFQGGTARVGRGRLVVNGEAAMFTAQIRGENRRKNGLTSPEAAQNLQFLLNIFHWLSGLLD